MNDRSIIVANHLKNQPQILTCEHCRANNLKSRSAWRRDGVKIPKDAKPIGVCFVETATIDCDPVPYPFDLVIDYIEAKGLVIIGARRGSDGKARFWEVFSSLSKQERGEGEGGFHYDAPESESLVIPTPNEFSDNHLNDTVINAKWYVPDSLKLDQFNQDERDTIAGITDLIIRQRIRQNLTALDFIPLKKHYLKKQFGRLEDILNKMIYLGIVQRDGYYVQGHKSYGYRLGEFHREERYSAMKITNPFIIKRRRKELAFYFKQPIYKFLLECLQRMDIDLDQFRQDFGNYDKFDDHYLTGRRFKERDYHFEVDPFGHRVHTNITNMSKALRQYLTIDGERLIEVDISTSQPVFLCAAMWKRGHDPSTFQELALSGNLYETIGQWAGLARDEAKIELMRIMYGKNGYNSPAKSFFKSAFPKVAAFIHKSKDHDHKTLAALMQQDESRLVIHGVCERLRERQIIVATVHDSFLIRPQDLAELKTALRNEFERLGIMPMVKVAGRSDSLAFDDALFSD